MKQKLRLKDKNKIAYDPETKLTWEGDKVIESEITSFVAWALGKGILEVVEDKEPEDKGDGVSEQNTE